MNDIVDLTRLEEKLGYTFKDKKYIKVALTHSSYMKEHDNIKQCNERLEFLGDAFFDAIMGEELFWLFSEKEEGFLSRIRATLVCEKSLAREAAKIELGEFMFLGKGEEKTGGRMRESILADAMEAVIGAIYLDGGFESVKEVVLRIFADAIEDARNGKYIITDYKTALQERLQKQGPTEIKYELVSATGPDHNKTFTVKLVIDGKDATTGVGKSKKQAEQQAACAMLNGDN